MTTRQFPRTLGQAFKGPTYACALERPSNKGRPVLRWIVASAVSVLAFFVITGVRP